MHQPHSTITPAVVRATAHTALARALPWRGYGRLVTATRLLHLLLLVAALRSSLSAVARRFRFAFSHETLRLLQQRRMAYAVPLRRKGAGANPRNDWFAQPAGTVTRRSWRAKDSQRAVTTWTVVRVRPHDRQVQVLAFGRWGADRATAA